MLVTWGVAALEVDDTTKESEDTSWRFFKALRFAFLEAWYSAMAGAQLRARRLLSRAATWT